MHYAQQDNLHLARQCLGAYDSQLVCFQVCDEILICHRHTKIEQLISSRICFTLTCVVLVSLRVPRWHRSVGKHQLQSEPTTVHFRLLIVLAIWGGAGLGMTGMMQVDGSH